MVFHVLLCAECYENVYNESRTNYPSFKVLKVFKGQICIIYCLYLQFKFTTLPFDIASSFFILSLKFQLL
jgi:hypothetical protein